MKGEKKIRSGLSFFLFLILGIFFFTCLPPKPTKTKSPSLSFSILYGANFSYRDLPKYFFAEKNLREKGSTLLFLDSKIFQGDFFYSGEKSFVLSLIRILNKIGVDALLVNADFLPLFQKMSREILDSSRFFLLASNLFKKEKGGLKKTIFHPFCQKKLNNENVILLHTISNSDEFLSDYGWEEEITFLKKRIPLLREKTPLIGCFTSNLKDALLPCFFIEKPKTFSLVNYQVTLTDDNFQIFSETIALSEEDEVLKREILAFTENVSSFLDTPFVKIRKTFPARKLAALLADFVVRKIGADFLLIKEPQGLGLRKGELTRRALWQFFGEPGFLVVGSLNGLEIEKFKKEKGLLLFPEGKKIKNISYRVVMSEQIFRQSTTLPHGFSYLPYTFLELASECLRLLEE